MKYSISDVDVNLKTCYNNKEYKCKVNNKRYPIYWDECARWRHVIPSAKWREFKSWKHNRKKQYKI